MQPSDQQSAQTIESREGSQSQMTGSRTDNTISPFTIVQRITAWVMIVSAILFAFIGIMAVWGVFGPNTGDIVWRALSSLAIIKFASLIINVAVKMIEEHRK